MAVRRRVLIGAAVAVVVAAGAAAAPWVFGIQAERAVHAVAIDAAGRDVTVRSLEIERGYRVSQLQGVLEVEGWLGDNYYRWAGEPLLLEVEAELVHGPLVRSDVRGWETAVALVRSEIQPPARWRREMPEYFAGNPWRAESLVGRGGDVVSDLRLAGYDGPYHSWDDVAGELATDGDGQAMLYLATPRWAWSGDNGAEGELQGARLEAAVEIPRARGRVVGARLSAESLVIVEGPGRGRIAGRDAALALNREFLSGDAAGRLQVNTRAVELVVEDGDGGRMEMERPRGEADFRSGVPLWTGTFLLGGDGYTTYLDAGAAGEPAADLGPWRFDGEVTESEGLAAVEVALDWTGDGSAAAGEHGESRLALRRMHAGAVADLSRALWGAWPSGDLFTMGFAVGERLLARMPDLLEAKPEVSFDAWQEGPDGRAEARVDVAYDGPANLGLNQWPTILTGVRGDGRLVMPRSTAEEVAAAILLQEALESGAPPSPEVEEMARRMGAMQIEAIEAEGWLVEENGRLATTARFENLLLTVNGREALNLGGL